MKKEIKKEGTFMKKQVIAMILAVTMAFCLCSCVVKEAAVTALPSTEPSMTVTPTVEPSPTPTAESVVSPIPTAEPDDDIPSEDMETFQAFLQGETSTTVGDDFHNDMAYVGYDFESETWIGAETMSIRDLTELVENSFNTEEMENLPDTQVDYAILKTMGGRPMLVVHYDNLVDFWGFCAYFVLGNYDGQLRLTYARDSWSRSYTELRQGLIFSGGGSGGAGDSYEWCGYIDEDGHYQTAYETEYLVAQWVAMDAYEIFGIDDIDWSVNCQNRLVTTDEGKFYDLDAVKDADLAADVDQEKLAQLRQYYTDQGYVEVEDAEAVIADALSVHNVDPDAPDVEDWTPWDITK